MILKSDFTRVDAIPVPQELQKTAPQVLEDYVQARINQLVLCLCQELSNHEQRSSQLIQQLSMQIAQQLPGVSCQPTPLANRDLMLRFTHDCGALGCLDLHCTLCKDNPVRKCTSNFASKYCVKDCIKAACGCNIRIELVDSQTDKLVTDSIPNLKLEVSILDGVLYKGKFLENGDLVEGTDSYNEELDRCAVLTDKAQPLLTAQSGNASGANDASGRLVLSMQGGKAELVDVVVVRSSEALLSGRKPPFRLLAKAKGTTNLRIKPVVSEAFVVNTRRARNDGKAMVPLVDDDVGKLDHMGRETVKKLQDLRAAALVAGEKLDIPDISVTTVGEFKALALEADQDAALKAKLLHVLKLSKDKWEEAKEHAFKAVAMDNFMRGWTTKNQQTCVVLLFKCRHGVPELSMPTAYTEKDVMSYASQWQDNTRDILRKLSARARLDWHKPGHPNWTLQPYDSDLFAKGDATTSIYNEGPMPTIATVNAPIIQLATPPASGVSPPSSTTYNTNSNTSGGNQLNGNGGDVSSGYAQSPGMVQRKGREGQVDTGLTTGKRNKPDPTSGNGAYAGAGYPPSTSQSTYQGATPSPFAEETPFASARSHLQVSLNPPMYASHPNGAAPAMNGNGPHGPRSTLDLSSPRDSNNPMSPPMTTHHSPAVPIRMQQLLAQVGMNPQGVINPALLPQTGYIWDTLNPSSIPPATMPPHVLPPGSMPMPLSQPPLSPPLDTMSVPLKIDHSALASDWSGGHISSNGAHIASATPASSPALSPQDPHAYMPGAQLPGCDNMFMTREVLSNGPQVDARWNNIPPASQPHDISISNQPRCFPFTVPDTWTNVAHMYPMDRDGAPLPGYPLPTSGVLPYPINLNHMPDAPNPSCVIPMHSLPSDIKQLPSLMANSPLNLQAPSVEFTDADYPAGASMKDLLASFPQPPSIDMGESLGLLHSLVLEDEEDEGCHGLHGPATSSNEAGTPAC